MEYINYNGRTMTTGEVKKGDIIKFADSDYIALGDSIEREDVFGTIQTLFVEHYGEVILFASCEQEDMPWWPCDGWEELETIDSLNEIAERCNVQLTVDNDGYLKATTK